MLILQTLFENQQFNPKKPFKIFHGLSSNKYDRIKSPNVKNTNQANKKINLQRQLYNKYTNKSSMGNNFGLRPRKF